MAIARAELTCPACGRTYLYETRKANTSEARSFIAWAQAHMTDRLCPDCYAKDRDADQAQAAGTVSDLGWSDLTGSDKQVAWANQIRAQYIRTLDQHDTDHPDLVPQTLTDGLREILSRISDAKWWIDKRDFAGTVKDISYAARKANPEAAAALKAKLQELEAAQ